MLVCWMSLDLGDTKNQNISGVGVGFALGRLLNRISIRKSELQNSYSEFCDFLRSFRQQQLDSNQRCPIKYQNAPKLGNFTAKSSCILIGLAQGLAV